MSGKKRPKIFQLNGLEFVKEISDQGFNNPMAVAAALDDPQHIIYVADTDNNRVLSLQFWDDEPGITPSHVFELFKAALYTNDLDRALTFIEDMALETYSFVLAELQPEFQNMVNAMGDLVLLSSENGKEKYKILHEKDDGSIVAFPVYFLKGSDCNWKIYCF